MSVDPLANALSKIDNAEKKNKVEVTIFPASKQIRNILQLLKREKYIKDFEFRENNRGGLIKVELSQSINNICVIKPRFPVKLEDFEKFEKRYLPAKDFGRLIISTSQGLLDHVEARKKKVGGVLIAYVY